MSSGSVMDSSPSNSDRSSHVSSSPKPSMTPPPISNNHPESPNIRPSGSPGHHQQLSPPTVSTPSSIVNMGPRLGMGLHPPGLGLLNSLGGMVHHSPLDLMAVAHHHGPPRSYNSPPPISSSDPTANECKLVDYRGHKVAAFMIAGETMLCLPQAFELFLKHLVGGLHTVYTKLKRLDIVPLVCNVEQVRILRGLGAIQPGVNRCKLLSCKDFDVLYRDCTTARCLMSHKPSYERPGRPPKRASIGLSLAASHLSHQLKKHRLENGDYPGYENGHLSDGPRLEKSPLLANGYNHPPTHLNHMQFMQLGQHPHTAILNPGLGHHPGLSRPDGSIIKSQPLPAMDAIARSGIWENCRAAYEDIVKHLERLREERGDAERALALDHKARDLSLHNGSSNGHSPVLNLSKSGAEQSGSEAGHTGMEDEDEDDNVSDVDEEDDKDQDLSDAGEVGGGGVSPHAINYSTLSTATPTSGPDPALNSTETLLRNIQGLLKVAADNARQQERQINYEKAELKMDVLREREVKDSLERQLMDEQKIRVLYQKRLKKERKARRRLQDQLELEMKRRQQLEEALKNSGAPPEALRILNESVSEREREREREPPVRNAESAQRSTPGEPETTAPPAYPQRPPPQPEAPPAEKQWNYSGLDLINSGAAFWQNYSESLAQELELERKSRQQQQQQQQQSDIDVKPPLQDSRAGYYKNSVLFSSAT